MSAPGRSEALALERAARMAGPMSAPGSSEALVLERAARKAIR